MQEKNECESARGAIIVCKYLSLDQVRDAKKFVAESLKLTCFKIMLFRQL